MTINDLSFNADWASPPGTTLDDLLEMQGRSLSEFAASMQWGVKQLKDLIKGAILINHDIAFKLESATGTPKDFWLERERQYRKSIERLEEQSQLEKEWLSELPTADMAKFGWIDKFSKGHEKLLACLEFFDVFSVAEWQEKYNCLLTETAFRTSPTFDSTVESIASWLRQGEIEASSIPCENWNRELLIDLLPEIRSLSTINCPGDFIPILQRYLSSCGVALTIVRSPKGCRASGAAFWSTPEKPILILSFRYLSDDHFWFTLFHEIGHLILHSDHRLILESTENSGLNIEKEADRFSEDVLIPKEFRQELITLKASNLRKIIKFSKKIGISKGVVVGQLQHKGVIPKNYLNKLKIRYSW